ncbi:MAG: sulfatase-like hydrolase/transferase [Candidatus Aminicenantes bacterium]|nr:MAG: sulfatase-like hydrolase/transferase [Candidatus Aminicenantes bacterium]
MKSKTAIVTRLLLSLIFFVLFLIGAGVYSTSRIRGEKKAEGMNLLVITLDTMRADRIGAYGYAKAKTPHLDGLTENGIMFANCYSPVPLTLPAHCSLFTGLYPLGHRVRDNGTFFLSDAEFTLAEMMESKGYDTYAVVASFVLMAKFGLNQGFSIYDDSLDANELLRNFYSEITADVVYVKFANWFRNREEKSFFAWVHFYDPHAPYEPPEGYRKGRQGLSDLYDGEVEYTDVYVGKIIQDLENEKILEDTLIVIVGDHGEAFGEHQEYGHSVFCYEENLKVPLIFFNLHLFPEGSVVEDRVSLIDIMPSLLEMFGMDSPPAIQGKSFTKMLAGKEEKKARPLYIESMYGKETLGWAPLAGIIDGPYKYISLPEPELYDLEKDDQEKNNLYPIKKDTARALDEKLKTFKLEYSSSGGSVRRKLTLEDRRRLESLGYISSFSPSAIKTIDPKKGILLLNKFNDANNLIERGRLDLAEAELRNVAAQNPEIKFLPYYELMAKIFEIRTDPQAVIETWKEAVEVFPANDRFKLSLAFKLLQVGQMEEAEALGLEITRIDDKSSRGLILLGRVEEKRGDHRKALMYFEKALDKEPNNVQLKLSVAQSLVKNGQRERALAMSQALFDDQTITGDPANAGILSKIGLIFIEGNRLEQARRILLDSVAMDDSNAESWNSLGVVYYRKKEYPKAVEAYERAVRLNPEFASAFNNLGTLYLREFLERRDPGMVPKAIDAFDRAINNDPLLAAAYNGRASAFKFSDRANEAIRDWKRAMELQPDFVNVYFNLGITYMEIGEKTEAAKILKLCKKKFYKRLSLSEQGRLDRLITEATR